MLPNPENSIETIAALLGVSVGTLYNHIPDLKELRSSRVPAQDAIPRQHDPHIKQESPISPGGSVPGSGRVPGDER
ncbi:hypothetical protein [Streptomyces sp. NPDC056190]|uniref:hypothetical protein n=1 Tax=unclassified Streptomyces TaxID=2593676 RepID=UPI0035DC12FF